MRLQRPALALALLAALAAGGSLALDRVFPPDLRRYEASGVLALASNGSVVAASGSKDHFWRLATTSDQVDPAFLTLLIRTEDKRFWETPGVDPVALLRAAIEDARVSRIVSGGSSITMQVARLLTPAPRTPWGKMVEICRALQLSAHYSRRQILAMYLTLAPYGGNIEGVQAASELYFGHPAHHLSQTEMALLVALPRRPEALRPDRHPQEALRAIGHIYAEEQLGPPPGSLTPGIFRRVLPVSPYLAARLRGQGARGVVQTSLDAPLQGELSNMAASAAAGLGTDADIAILVLRNRDDAVLAYIGGAGLAESGGDVDMIQAFRSPGSTLKPFIYGMAFDRGIAEPGTLIDDTPLANATYNPADFDRSWHGIVPVAVALQQSYNLPAVKMLGLVGPLAFMDRMRAAGMDMLLPQGDTHPSLAVALGGVGVRLNDLCALYAGLAEGGHVAMPRIAANAPLQFQAPVMSAASAAQILGILEGLPPPDGTAGFGGRVVGYKTGTSYGFRDAWSIAVSADDTVGVWVGRPDDTPRPGAYGLNTAAPLMAAVFALLPPDTGAMPLPILAPQLSSFGIAPALLHIGAMQAVSSHPRITFPPPGSTVEADPGTPIPLQVSGGAAPYRWIIDGQELPPVPIGETSSWTPPGPGFFHISVIDQANVEEDENIQVR